MAGTAEQVKITPEEYRAAVRAAPRECVQETNAAAEEYRDAVRPHATRRKQRAKAARTKRDNRLAELKEQLHASAAARVASR